MYVNGRRNFLKFGFLSTSLFLMSGCELVAITTPRETLKLLQYDLFPKAKELGINTIDYMDIVFSHSRITNEDKTFIKNGAKWLNETALEIYNHRYTSLSSKERQDVLTQIAKTRWGESWIHEMLSYILEASFGDPIYGGNNKEAGWKWLAFEGGKPRPSKAFL